MSLNLSAQEGAQNAPEQQQQAQGVPEAVAAPPPSAPVEPVTLLVRSAVLADQQGITVGYLEGVVVDPASGQVTHGLASVASQNMRNIVTPIPWPMLRPASTDIGGGSMAGRVYKFSVPVPRTTLLAAPRLNLALPASANGQGWMAASAQYFTAAGAAIGGVGPNATGVQTGGDASGVVAPIVGVGSAIPATLDDLFSRGTNLFGTNFFTTVFGSNFMATNGFALTNPAFSTNLFVALTNFFSTNVAALTNRLGTNQFVDAFGRPRTNIFGTNTFVGSTNVVPGTRPDGVGAPPRVLQSETGNDGSSTVPRGVRPVVPRVAPGVEGSAVPPGYSPSVPRDFQPSIPPGTVPPNSASPAPGRTPTAPPPAAPAR